MHMTGTKQNMYPPETLLAYIQSFTPMSHSTTQIFSTLTTNYSVNTSSIHSLVLWAIKCIYRPNHTNH